MDKIDFKLMPGQSLNTRIIKSTNKKPLVSIITAYYNAEKFVFETATSILNQTFPYFEWIIVNDGSTSSETDKTLEKLKKLDSRIKVIDQKNSGPASARVNGVKNASSDLVFILDSDDLIDKTMLECGYFTMLTNKEAVWAYTPIITFGDDNFIYNPKYTTKLQKKENLMCGNYFVRKDKFLEVIEYDKLPKEVHEDWYMNLTFLSKKYRPLKMNFYGFWYRRLNSGRLGSINNNKKQTKIAEKYLNKVRRKITFDVHQIEFPLMNDFNFESEPKKFKVKFPQVTSKDNTKRILLILPWAMLGGADIFNLNLIKKLKSEGYEISIVTTESCKYDLRQDFEKYVDEFFDLTTFLSVTNWAPFISYLIETRNINLVFQSNSFYGYHVIPWLKTIHKDVIFTDYVHAQDFSWREGGYPKDSIAISSYLDKTFTCTKYLKELMENEMSSKKLNIDVSYIGTDVDKFNPDIEYKHEKELKEKYKGKKVILFPCRTTHVKRPLFMCNIMKELSKKHKDYICLFVGTGELINESKEFVKENNLQDVIEFIPAKKDIRVYYKIAHITIVCSLTEGLTLTAYESLAMGVPVISSDVGGQKELVNDNCGKIMKTYQNVKDDFFNFNYDKKEINEYIDAIIKIVESKNYSKMCKNCREIILKDFSENMCLQKLYNSLDDMVTSGTKVNKELCSDVELASRYLTLFNEYYYKPVGFVRDNTKNIKKIIGDKFWKYKAYRGFIRCTQIIKGMK